MYPTVVIVLVETQRSMADVCGISPSNACKAAGLVASEPRPATLEHVSFVLGTVRSRIDDEAKSQCSHASKCDLEEDILEVKEPESDVAPPVIV